MLRLLLLVVRFGSSLWAFERVVPLMVSYVMLYARLCCEYVHSIDLQILSGERQPQQRVFAGRVFIRGRSSFCTIYSELTTHHPLGDAFRKVLLLLLYG